MTRPHSPPSAWASKNLEMTDTSPSLPVQRRAADDAEEAEIKMRAALKADLKSELDSQGAGLRSLLDELLSKVSACISVCAKPRSS